MTQGNTMSKSEDAIAKLCALIERGGLDRRQKLESAGRICYEIKSTPTLLQSFPSERLIRCARKLLPDPDTSTRSAALRLLRHSICSSESIKALINLCVPIFVVRSMDREQKLLAERIQALKVIRRIMEIDAIQMPASVVMSMVAIAGHKDDNLRRICMETLRELALANVAIVAQANGIRLLVDAILEPSFQDLADSLILTLLFLLNEPTTRLYLDPFLDTQILLAPFTDTDLPAGNERRQRWIASRHAIVTMMRSWPGIVVLVSNPQGMQSLVQLLVRPVGEDVQKAVLATICEIFYKKADFDQESSSSSTTKETSAALSLDMDLHTRNGQHDLLDHYKVMLLLAMIHCGILDALITLGTGTVRSLADTAIDLLADILRMASRLLPDQHCASLLALPRLVSATSLGTTPTQPIGDQAKALLECSQREKSIRASEMLAELATAVGASSGSASTGFSFGDRTSSYANGVHLASELLRDTNRPYSLPHMKRANSNISSFSSQSSIPDSALTGRGSLASREIMMQELKLSLDSSMDDATFKDLLHTRSKVLLEKVWTKWNWDVISELLEGPLTNPVRLTEAMKTKFFKRLSGFFRCDPGNKGFFSQLAWIPDFLPFLRPACQMYTLLLNHPEGLLFLKTDRRGQLLREISLALELEARPEAAIVESHIGALNKRMFSPDYCSRRMLREYFTLLGLMSSSKEGLKMMEQSNLFQRLYDMGTAKGHDFLCRLILGNLDYSVGGGSRKLLQAWMSEGSRSLRLYATCLLRALLRSEVADFENWGIDALISQLTQEEEVARSALSVLEEASENEECLRAMILKQPVKLLLLKDKRAESLLLKFLSLQEGLTFLMESGDWIPNALRAWGQEKHIAYVHAVENALFRGLNCDINSKDSSSSTSLTNSNNPKNTCNPVPIPVNIPMRRGSMNHPKSMWGLDWLYRMPWNMEVRLVGPSGASQNLLLETFVDGSLRDDDDTPLHEDDLRTNLIRVKAIIMDARNAPQPVNINTQHTLQACLFLGTQPVDRNGFTKPAPQSNGGFVMPSSSSSNDSSQLKNDRSRSRSQANSGPGENRGSEGLLNNPLDFQDPSIPVPELATEENKDWSSCQPEHRSSQFISSPICSICPPGERAVWNFRADLDSKTNSVRSLSLKSVEFTLQLLPGRPRTVSLPPHMYGELAKTSQGCQILLSTGCIPEFITSLRNPAAFPLEKRAALWSLCHIAATARGYELVQRYATDVFELIVRIATTSQVVSLRGTSFFIIGLLSRSDAGRRHLSRLGWDTVKNPRTSIAVPQNSNVLFSWPQQNSTQESGTDHILRTPSSPVQVLLTKVPKEWQDILRYVADLSNHITQKEAHASLLKLRQSKSDLFDDPMLLLYVHALLEKYSYRLALRQFVLNSFDKATLTEEVLDSIQDDEGGYRTTSGYYVPHPGTLLSTNLPSPYIPRVTSTVQSLSAAIQTVSGRASMANAISSIYPNGAAGVSDRPQEVGNGAQVGNQSNNADILDHPMAILKRNRNRSAYSERTIVVGAPEAVV